MCIEVNASDAVLYGTVFFGFFLSTRLCGKFVVFPQDCELESSQVWRRRLPTDEYCMVSLFFEITSWQRFEGTPSGCCGVRHGRRSVL